MAILFSVFILTFRFKGVYSRTGENARKKFRGRPMVRKKKNHSFTARIYCWNERPCEGGNRRARSARRQRPDHWRGYQFLNALNAQKDAYCEKPITHWRQVELTHWLLKAVRKFKRITQVGVQCMSSSAWEQTAKMIQQGDIGKPLHAQAGFRYKYPCRWVCLHFVNAR